MANGIAPDRTRTSATEDQPAVITRTRTIDELVDEAGHVRNTTRLIESDVAEVGRRASDLHHRAFATQLNNRAREVAKREPRDLLEELASDGFSWRDIARLVGVTVPAVRRWRQGESSTGEHRLAISRLVAFVELLRVDQLVTDVASWMEIPLIPEVPVTGIDLAVSVRYEDLLDLAAQHVSPEDVLDRWQPDWRDRYWSDFEVFEAADGELGIRASAPQDE